MKKKILTILCAFPLLLSFCSNENGNEQIKVSGDANTLPSMEKYFNGDIKGWGILQNRRHKVTKRFNVDMKGTWNGNKGVLKTVYYYSNGQIQRRKWEITKKGESYEGKAADIHGTAHGTIRENAINWKYTLVVPIGKKKFHLKGDDWQWEMKDGVMINRIYFRKFGFIVAEMTLFMKKV